MNWKKINFMIKENLNNMVKKINDNIFQTIIDVILCISIIVLSIKKGGFYKADMLAVALVILFLALIIVFVKKVKRVSVTDTLFIILIVSYTLPIIFKSYTNLNDAIFEALRYVCLYATYLIVKNSKNVKIYKITFIVVATLQTLLGIDGMGSRLLKSALTYFSSGYLGKDYDRLSGTIQYANITALVIFTRNICYFGTV